VRDVLRGLAICRVVNVLTCIVLAGALQVAAVSAQQRAPVLREFPFIIHFAPGAQRLAARVLNMARALDSLPGIPPAFWRNEPIEIILAPTEAAFQSVTGGRTPEWGAGVAVPTRGLIVLPAWGSLERGGPLDYGTVLRHELAHIALHRAAAPARVPRWFDEGYATWVAGQLDWNRAWVLRAAFLTGRAPPLDSLTLDWPRTAARAQLAYLLSATVIEYLVQESGTFGLQRLLERARAGGNFEQALIDTYGVDTGRLESEWRRHVKRKYGWTVVVTQSALFSVLAGTILIFLFVLRRARDRRKLAELRLGELPDIPAFWGEGGIEIIAHRGYSAYAPENTRVAMEMAIRAGASALEFDVHASADGVPVVIHDDKLARTTNGHGKVAEQTCAQLQTLDAGRWFAKEFAGERIPTLAELLASLGTKVNRFYIELKPGALAPAHLATIVQLVEQTGLAENCVIMSFDWSYLQHIRTRSPRITLAFLADDEPRFLGALERARADGRALVDCNYKILLHNNELVRYAHNMNVELAVYTVNDVRTASRLAELGVHRITTNEVEKLLRWAAGREKRDA
jgi:glycerophosphoryl diester phosphodiesterase